MVFGRMNQRRRREAVIIEEVSMEEEEPICTFDDDADPSIERCSDYADEPDMRMKNAAAGALPENSFSREPLILGMAGITLACAIAMAMMFLRDRRAKRAGVSAADPAESTERTLAKPLNGKAQPPGVGHQEDAPAEAQPESRVKELKLVLERETKEKQGLSEQNNFLKSALEERKATVQMFTSELQSRDEQLVIFEQEQIKVKNELYNQIEALKNELQVQEKHQQKNLNNMDGQCADLANKVEGLMKELANREEQWENFEQEAKAKENNNAAQIESIKQEFAAREQSQKATLATKDKQCADLSATLETLAKEKKESEVKLLGFGKQREKWKAATAEMKRLLKDKREEIVGLTTRMELFMGELKSREDRVRSLEQKLVDKNDLTSANLEDLQKAVQEQRADHETWSARTAEISEKLEACKEESSELAEKLESITAELKSTSENVVALETTVEDREFLITSNRARVDKLLQGEEAQKAHWIKEHSSIKRLLQERQEECASLTARVEIFAVELKAREKIVGNLEAKVQDKKKFVVGNLQSMAKGCKGAQAFRDTWSGSTKGIYNMLEQKKEEIVGLTTRVDLFQLELEKREDRVATLKGILKEKEDANAAVLEPYRIQLKTHQEDLDKWANNTEGIKQLLQNRKGECVGLTTRLKLFKGKVDEYQTNVSNISAKVHEKEGSQTVDLFPLREQLKKQQAEHSKWSQQTIDIGNQLKDRQGQCVGLTTRVVLFKRQTKFHEAQVAVLESKAADLEERFSLKIDPVRKELQVQKEGLEAWKKSTLNVKKLLEEANQASLNLTAELKTNVVKLQGYQKEVSSLQDQVIAKEEVAVSHEDQYLAQRKEEEEELENWRTKTDDLEQLLKTKEGQIAGLSTRVLLFNSELSTRETTVTALESKVKERSSDFEDQVSSLRNELKFQKEQRDHCLDSTLSMNRSMKEVKEPCVGLTTRLSLFRKELAGREERVRILAAQVQEKEQLANFEIGPIRNEFEKQRKDRDDWNESTNRIFQLLKSRKESITGTTTRLELFMSELQKKEDAVDAAEARLNEVDKGISHIANLATEIKAQEEQKRKWEDSTAENSRLLRLKEEQRSKSSDKRLEQECASLSAKLDLFQGEIQRREEKVKELRATSTYRGESLASEKAALVKEIPALKEDRDSWMEKTLAINTTVKDTQAECVGLSTRWDLFKIELKNKSDNVDGLALKLKEKEEHHDRMISPYKNELKIQADLVAKWVETTEKMGRLLKKKESECVSFTTQLETAIDELSSRKEQVAQLEARLDETVDFSNLEMTRLKQQLASAGEELVAWKTSTKNVEKSLRDTRQECGNLKVRLQVFRRQVDTQDGRVAALASAHQAKKDGGSAVIETLKARLREQQTSRDESVSCTLAINQQIKDKEMQCTSISVRLSLFRTELENREKNVASLESKLEDAEGMSAAQLNPVKAHLQQQKDEVAKWVKNTRDVEQLLKQRDEERVGLATRLQLFQQQVKSIEESLAVLSQRVKNREESAASAIAPFRNALEEQQGERERWTKLTLDIVQLLKDRKAEITGLSVRLSLFRKEVKHREAVVEKIEGELNAKEADLNEAKIEPIEKELASLTQERNGWAVQTANLVKMLKDKRGECDGLNTRLEVFKMELQKREEACNVLLKKYEDEKNLAGSQIEVLQSELAMQMEQRDKWRETTADMKQQLEERQTQCTGLATRVELFKREIEGHNDTIADLKLRVQANEDAIAEVEGLKKELKIQQDNRDSLSKAMEETGQLLKAKKEQCSGLATRLVVFRQQLKERMGRLNATETRIKEKEELSNAQIESLKTDLQSQKEQRNKWSETTEELKKLLEEKESQCSIISAELELLTSLQTGTM